MKLPNFFKKKKKSLYTIAFYNVENLFDHIQDTNILDTESINNDSFNDRFYTNLR